MEQPPPTAPETDSPEALSAQTSEEEAASSAAQPDEADDSLNYLRRVFGGCLLYLVLLAVVIGGLFVVGRDAFASLSSYLRGQGLSHLPVSGTSRISYEFIAATALILFVASLFALFPLFLYRSFEQTKKARIQGDVWVDLLALGYWTKLRLSAETNNLIARDQSRRSRSASAESASAQQRAASLQQLAYGIESVFRGREVPDSEEEIDQHQLALREFSRRFEENYGQRAFVWPLALLTALYLVGWLTVLLPNGLTGGEQGPVLAGLMTLMAKGFGGYITAVLGKLNIISAAFLGAYLFSMQGLFWRYVRSDFKPTAVVQASLRLIVAWIVAFIFLVAPDLGLGGPLAKGADPTLSANVLKALGFTIGIFPLQILTGFINGVVKQIYGRLPGFAPNTELTELDGLDNWHADRLDEAGVRYVRGLATADFLDLLLSVRLPTETLLDWVDQALLRMHVSAAAWKDLQDKTPLRTATDLLDVARDESAKANLIRLMESESKPFATALGLITDALQHDPNIAYVQTFRQQQSAVVKHDQAFPAAWPIRPVSD